MPKQRPRASTEASNHAQLTKAMTSPAINVTFEPDLGWPSTTTATIATAHDAKASGSRVGCRDGPRTKRKYEKAATTTVFRSQKPAMSHARADGWASAS